MEFRTYADGQEFYNDNRAVLNGSSPVGTELAFFNSNIKKYERLDTKNFAFKFSDGDDFLLVLKVEPYNMLMYGADRLAAFAANIIADYHLQVEKVLGEEGLLNAFFSAYQERLGGKILHGKNMDILYCEQIARPFSEAVNCSKEDIDGLAEIYVKTRLEFFNEEISIDTAKNALSDKHGNFYALKKEGRIVSIAAKREYGNITGITNVFTLPECRGKGYAKKVVGKLTYDILKSNKLPYLFVEKQNVPANRLYKSLGYKVYKSYSEIKYTPENVRQALFAGGCFWCMAKPYYEYEGINRVFSGYAGGDVINPAYEDVKRGATHHRETVMLEYNREVIGFKQLLDIYFDTIDPFDDGGQFIDRGENYTCAIFTDDEEEKEIIAGYINRIESESDRKVQVKILGNQVFYKAEEYHQDYALKNPEAMEEELKNSGRLK